MKVKYIESVVLFLPNFNGSFDSKGGLNFKKIIQWYKTDENTEFIGLNDDEAMKLLNLLSNHFKTNVSESVIKDIEDDNLPYIPFDVVQKEIRDYELSKIFDYSRLLDFEVKGYLPT